MELKDLYDYFSSHSIQLMKKGSGIHIKKANRGKFTEYCGGKVTNECMNLAEGFIQPPLQEEVLLNIINSHLKIKKSLDRLYENNKELSRSLYQLNVLYNTSSQFAGTLNTEKL